MHMTQNVQDIKCFPLLKIMWTLTDLYGLFGYKQECVTHNLYNCIVLCARSHNQNESHASSTTTVRKESICWRK